MSKKSYEPVYNNNGVEILNNFKLLNFLNNREDLVKSNLLVCLSLAIRRNSTFGSAFPSKTTLSKDTGLSPSGVKKVIRDLIKMRFLFVVNLGKYNKNGKEYYDGISGNSYYFNYDFKYFESLVDDDKHPIHYDIDQINRFEQAQVEFRNLDTQ